MDKFSLQYCLILLVGSFDL